MPVDALLSNALAAVPSPVSNGFKRARSEAETSKKGNSNLIEKAVAMLDSRLRVIESFTEEVFLLPASGTLSLTLLQAMAAWKSKKPESGPHPDGAARLTVAAALLTFIGSNVQMAPGGAMQEHAASLQSLCQGINKFEDLDQHVAMCMAKQTKKGDQVLLKFTWSRYSSLNHSIQLQLHVLAPLGAIHQAGPAPKGHIVRQLG